MEEEIWEETYHSAQIHRVANYSIDTPLNKTCALIPDKRNDGKHNQANAETKEYPPGISERTQGIRNIKSGHQINEQSN